MDANKLIGMLMLMTGVLDVIVFRTMGPKLAPQARVALLAFGIGFFMLGVAVTFGFIRLA